MSTLVYQKLDFASTLGSSILNCCTALGNNLSVGSSPIIGSVIAEIFRDEDSLKMLSQQF